MKKLIFSALTLFTCCAIGACSAGASPSSGDGDGDTGPGDGDSDIDVGDGDGDGDSDIDVGDGDNGGGMIVDEPATCADAAASKSYTGCEFWPTVLANPVFTEFDFAVVVANGQNEEASVEISGPGGFSTSVTVAAGGLETILLPWVAELKGPEFDVPNTPNGRLDTSLSMKGGAYRMTSSIPVAAWQFNPLQYKKTAGTGEGQCGARLSPGIEECRAASNDASILLPTTAMTGNYVVGAYSRLNEGTQWGSVPGGFSVTATQNGTEVIIETSKFCFAKIWPTGEDSCIAATPTPGAGSQIDIPELGKDEQLVLTMDAGDVIQLVGKWAADPNVAHADVSGSVINASAPVQVFGFNAIAQVPDANVGNADHLEDTILPAEVIGNKYIVAPPTAFGGAPIGHIVRFFGTTDGTTLTYPEGKPAGAPDTLQRGEMVQLPAPLEGTPPPSCAASTACYTDEVFVVEGDQPFSVVSIMLGGDLQSPSFGGDNAAPGDPSMSMMVTPEQFRTAYTFLAPADFEENYADILVPDGATATLDGATLGAGTPIGASGWSIVRALLDNSTGGIHSLTTEDERGLGLQVLGFGSATSFYYPGGLDLKLISEPPVIIVR